MLIVFSKIFKHLEEIVALKEKYRSFVTSKNEKLGFSLTLVAFNVHFIS